MRSWSRALALAFGMGFVGAPALLVAGRAAADPSPLDQGVISNYNESETPRSAAMGGALRALGAGTTGIFLNPAAMAEGRAYHVEALTQFTPETRRWVVGGTVIDSVTSRLAASFSIQGTPIAMDPDGISRSVLDLRLGLAFPISDRFILGVTGRYLKATQSGLAGMGFGFGASTPATAGIDKPAGGLVDTTSTSTPQARFALVNTVTFDAGLIIKPTDSLYIAAVGQNLTYTKNGFLPMIVGGGVGYGTDMLSIEVDGIADLTSWSTSTAMKPTARVMGGAEYMIGGMVPARLGLNYDQGAKLTTLSVGTGYVGNQFAVEAATKRTLSNPGATTIFLSFSYYIEATGLTRPVVTTPELAQ